MQDLTENEAKLRAKLIDWILTMKDEHKQPDYARQALINYDRDMSWLRLKAGVRDAMKAVNK